MTSRPAAVKKPSAPSHSSNTTPNDTGLTESQMRAALDALGISHAHCTTKAELAGLLCQAAQRVV